MAGRKLDTMSVASSLRELSESYAERRSGKVAQETAKNLLHNLLPQAHAILDAASVPADHRATQRETLQNAMLQLNKAGQHKIAFIGETGSGKSTLLNALIGKEILSASATDPCTAVPTELSYQEFSQIDVFVQFKRRDVWEQHVDNVLAEARNTTVDTEDPAGIDSATMSRVLQARESFISLYPQCRGIPPNAWNKSELLEDHTIASVLGACKQFQYSADSSDLRPELEQFLASVARDDQRAFWLLVQCVKVVGPFKILSSGITLVDLPGYGDIDPTRDRAAKDYLKTADSVCLVARISRAPDNAAFITELERQLRNAVLAGRAVDKSISVILTGADAPIANHELPLPPDEQAKIDELDQIARECKQLSEHRRQEKKEQKEHGNKAQIKQLNEEIKRLNKCRSKALKKMFKMLATARVNLAMTRLNKKFGDIHRALASDSDSEEKRPPPELPIFGVGTRDYLRIKGLDSADPGIFLKKNETGIPAIQKYIEREGERQMLLEIWRVMSAFCSFIAWASQKCASALTTGIITTNIVGIVDDLEARCLAAAANSISCARTAYLDVVHVLDAALKNVEIQSPSVFARQELKKWNTYAYMMRQQGRYLEGTATRDLNEDLTDEVWTTLQIKWNTTFNDMLPFNHILFRQRIKHEIDQTLLALVPLYPELGHPRCQVLLDLQFLMGRLEVNNRTLGISVQRKSVRIMPETMEDQLRPQYAKMAQEQGPGMFVRMKTANRQYIRTHAPMLFSAIGESVRRLLSDSLNILEVEDRRALQTFFVKMKQALAQPSAAQPETIGLLQSEAANTQLREFIADHAENCYALLALMKDKIDSLKL
ncbi:Glycosyltransferase family 22 protein [Mycena kentingensis (nom. inval.)]|nr:Glycosyltransferase family 22 protein [Mycena kentingensis (nom. inval.)]